MAFVQQLYQAVFRRTSTLVLTVVVGAVIFERGFNQATEAIFCRLNEGDCGRTSSTNTKLSRTEVQQAALDSGRLLRHLHQQPFGLWPVTRPDFILVRWPGVRCSQGMKRFK